MEHIQFDWQNADGLKIFAQGWLPEIIPLGVVFLVHGQGEHSSRYAHVAGALNKAGYAVMSFDHQGHGQSQGPRGDMSSYKALLDDVGQLFNKAGQRFPNAPCFLYGHSMGGNLVLNYVLRRQPQLNGVVVTSPWLRLAFEPPALQITAMRLISRIWPSFTISSGLETSAISRDPAVVAAYENDPLNHDQISVRQLIQVDQAGQWALDHAGQFTFPLLIMHGSGDRITSYQSSRQFADKVSGDCTFELWDGLYHEPHNEPEKQQFIGFIINWLRLHLPG
jgi:alpha-beta hydrolase superfamily lysophospholipase